jgi:small membrane protein
MIKLLMIALLLVLSSYFLQNRNTHRLQAGKKLIFLVFVTLAVVTILEPGLTTDIAHVVGVGRGADLLLYALALSFVFATINAYLKFKDYEQRLTQLARRTALAEAALEDKLD